MVSVTKLFDLTGRTALVTGASYGLGTTFAEALGMQGANVVLAARSVEKLEATAAKLGAAKSLAVKCDVGDAAQVASLFERSVAKFGRVDIVVNNAGINDGFVPERIKPEVFEQTVRVNLVGVWNCCYEAAQIMLRDGKGGSIINIASVAGLGGMGQFPPAYQATKGAVINLTRNLAASWADRGVRVNAIAPGWFPSEMTAGVFAIPVFQEWVRRSAPMGRTGEPDELVVPLLFLASDASSFVTGTTLVVDGGLSAAWGEVPEAALGIMAEAGYGDLARKIRPEAAAKK
jgi:NAD(P)-dependent dehydrogenase (short-subunit alcohol dehydrogenase family)